MCGMKKHKGNPKPARVVWASPAPEREKRKKRQEHGVDEQTKQREEGGTQTVKPATGRVLKGSKYRITHRPLRKTKT